MICGWPCRLRSKDHMNHYVHDSDCWQKWISMQSLILHHSSIHTSHGYPHIYSKILHQVVWDSLPPTIDITYRSRKIDIGDSLQINTTHILILRLWIFYSICTKRICHSYYQLLIINSFNIILKSKYSNK